MIKFITNLLHRNNPECICGYKMKSSDIRKDDYSWKCIWKKCGYEVFESPNGKLHWFKK